MNLKKVFLLILGSLMLGLGMVGIVLPLLPTTPLLLVAAACFSASSAKMHDWLARHKYLGAYLDNYRNKRGIPIRVKIHSLIMLWAMLGITMAAIGKAWVVATLFIIGIAVTVHLLTIQTKKD